ncbi:PQQ-binding-like beta-propeller repeat protein [Natrinema sp. H-ect1]|uniref:outer membrane protein assembly factor BamB family protein n=1 Tax=Natrinema sp. H-ect1 TaxID=3242700 RepID=UPI00359DE5BA
MTEWNQFKGDPHNSGCRREIDGPTRVTEGWTADLVGPPGSPVCDRDTVYVGTTRGNCYALERATGRRRWVVETTAATDAAPLVTRDRLFLGTADGTVRALDPGRGEVEWEVDLADGLEAALALASGRLYVGHADGLTALEPETGTELWTHETESAVVGAPAVADGREGRRRRSALERDDPSATDSLESTPSDPLAADRTADTDGEWAGDRIFAGTAYGAVVAVDAETGEEVWTAPADGTIEAGPTVADGRVYVADDEGTMVAMDAGTGQSWFTYEIRDAFTTSATVLSAAETTFVGAADGYCHVTDTTVGRRKLRGWLFSRKGIELDGPIRSCPVVAGDVVCVGDASGSIYGIDVADDCDLAWHVALEDGVIGTPAIGDGRLFVGCEDARLHCLEWDDEPRR